MLRAIFGLLKGILAGGGVGYALIYFQWTGGAAAYLACALVGLLVGILCGRPPWKAETIWTPIVKMIFGALVGAGLCALGRRFLPSLTLAHVGALDLNLHSGAFLAVAIGALYGVFVEVDDGGKTDADKANRPNAGTSPNSAKPKAR